MNIFCCKTPTTQLMEELRIPCVHVSTHAEAVALKPGIYMGREAIEAFDAILAECSAGSRFRGGQSIMEPVFRGRPVYYSPHLHPNDIVIVPRNRYMELGLLHLFEAREQDRLARHVAAMGAMEHCRQIQDEADRVEREQKAIRYTLKQPIRWRRCILLGATIGGWIVYAIAIWKYGSL